MLPVEIKSLSPLWIESVVQNLSLCLLFSKSNFTVWITAGTTIHGHNTSVINLIIIGQYLSNIINNKTITKLKPCLNQQNMHNSSHFQILSSIFLRSQDLKVGYWIKRRTWSKETKGSTEEHRSNPYWWERRGFLWKIYRWRTGTGRL